MSTENISSSPSSLPVITTEPVNKTPFSARTKDWKQLIMIFQTETSALMMDDLKAMKRSAERIAEKLKELSSCLEEINNLQNKIDAKDGFKATSKNGGSFGIDKEAILNQLDKLKSRLNESGMNVESIGKTKKSLTTNRDDDWKFAIPVFNFVWACKRVDDLRAGRETEKTEVDVRREDFSGWSQVTNNRANQLNTEQSTAMADVQHTMNQLQEMQSRVSAMLTALGNAEQAVVSSR